MMYCISKKAGWLSKPPPPPVFAFDTLTEMPVVSVELCGVVPVNAGPKAVTLATVNPPVFDPDTV